MALRPKRVLILRNIASLDSLFMAFQSDSIYWVEVEKIVPNPFQPRREFDEGKLKELAESIRMYGVLQPLTVTRKEVQGDDGSFFTEYELIAGERRLRASRLAGLAQVPVIIREGDQTQQEKLELAIIENLQREDLNAIDRGIAFRQLADVFKLSHSQIAKKVGRSREYVSNSIRLLALPDYMQDSLRLGDITEGHSRTLLTLNDRPEEQDVVFREVLFKKLSVRETEKIVRGLAQDKIRKKTPQDTAIMDLEKEFTEALGTRVSIVRTDFGGKLTIDYFSMEDLEEMLEVMRNEMANSNIKNNYKNSYQNHVDEDLQVLTESTPLATVADEGKSGNPTEKGGDSNDLANFVAQPLAVEKTDVKDVPVSEESVFEVSHNEGVNRGSETDSAAEIELVAAIDAIDEEAEASGLKEVTTAAAIDYKGGGSQSTESAPTVSTLQQQLNSLLGRKSPSSEVVGKNGEEVLRSVHDQKVVSETVNEKIPTSDSLATESRKGDDGDDLYSVRNFSV